MLGKIAGLPKGIEGNCLNYWLTMTLIHFSLFILWDSDLLYPWRSGSADCGEYILSTHSDKRRNTHRRELTLFA